MSYRGISTETVKVTGHKGDEIEAYLARPAGDGPYPGVVVIHHMPGWDEWTLEVCWKLAHHGFATIAPHLYSRFGPGDPDDVAARGRGAGGMSDEQVVGDVDGSAKYLRGQPYCNGKIGVIGFCSGGRQAWIVACKLKDIDAVVDCWGGGVIVDDPSQLNELRPVAPISLTPDLNCPLLGIFGNDDDNPSPAEVDRTEEELKRLGKTYEFYRYDGAGHAFFSTDRYRYRPEQAVDAWGKVFAFFRRYLQAPVKGTPPRFIGPSPSVSLAGRVPLRPS
ncbi:MAG TPA: dienelactone hydrolase family protein [Dehalococcoidia bacterium]|nr:dienelactone hydrolase family protein [Dehalococcoidia bacterium]